MVWDSARQRVVLFGGISDFSASWLGDTWEFDGTVWRLVSTSGPTPRRGHSMSYDSIRQRVVLFGGETNFALSRETWEWDGATWSLRNTSGPAARWGAAMAFDSIRGVTVLTSGGGFQPGPVYNDTWEWNGVAWSQRAVSGPTPRIYTRMGFDAAAGKCVIASGCSFNCSSVVQDTWTFDGATWVQASPSTPFIGPMAFEPNTRSIWAFNGEVRPLRWDGSSWTAESVPGPTPRFGYDVVAMGASGTFLLFGGYRGFGSSVVSDSWTYRVPTQFDANPATTVACISAITSLSVVVAGAGPFGYQWRKDGVSIDAVDVPTAATATLVLVNVQATDAGSYDCMVTNPCGSTISDAATLTVCAADFNCSGGLSVQDIFDFLAAYFGGDTRADFNGSGAISVQDIFDFLAAYFAGCI